MSEGYWEHYSHPADMGIRGFGAGKEEAFAQAALALTAVIAELSRVQPKKEIEIRCEEQDDEALFVSWLNALIYQMATRNLLFSKFDVSIKDHQLLAKVWGDTLNVEKHRPVVEVKAATYADLKVAQNADGSWLAQCIIDV
jgi:tRNA nucleotidyltransferase (CCA-adding enzyme)